MISDTWGTLRSNRVKSENNESGDDDSQNHNSLPPPSKRSHKGSENKRSEELGFLIIASLWLTSNS